MKMKAIAVVIGLVLIAALSAIRVSAQSGYDLFQKALAAERADGNLRQAIQLYERVVKDAGRDRALVARALIRMAECYQRLGDSQARQVYERVLREFGDQPESAAAARTHLQALSPPTDLVRQTARQIWSGDGVDGSGTPSADGRYLSFTDWETGDLAVRDLATNTSRHLTNTGAPFGDYSEGSLISPDGRLIAYNWFNDKERRYELRLMSLSPAEAARPRTVLQGDQAGVYIMPVGVVPDASAIVIVRSLPGGTNQIGVVSIRDGAYRSIKSLDQWRYPTRVNLSPDGRYIAYDVPAGDNGAQHDIFVLAIDGSRESVVVSGTADDSRPLWTPDGAHIVFLSDRTGTNQSLWSVAVENGRAISAPVLLKADMGPIEPLGITRGGALVYEISGRTRQNIYTMTWDGVKATGRPALITEQFVNSSTGPAWSPDGQSLAFYSLRGRPELVIRSMTTGAERIVATPTGLFAPFQSGPIWFPDGQSMLILVKDGQGSGPAFYRLHVDSGKTDLLHRVDDHWGPSSFALSPDGNSIFWTLQHSSDVYWPSGRLLRFDVGSNRETILKSDEWFITVAVSPDGKQLAYVKSIRLSDPERNASVIEVMPIGGGQPREVYRNTNWAGGARYNTMGWTPDSKSTMFVDKEGKLWRVSNTGGEPQQVGVELPKTRIKTPTIDPAGKRLAFGAFEADNNEIWSLEHFLPATTTNGQAR
jgi:Tol biopolymer transport system component